MGATAGSALSPADAFGGDGRDELLEELVVGMAGLRAQICALAEDPDSARLRDELIARLRSLALRAQAVGQVQLSEELRGCRVIVQASGLLQALSLRDREQLDEGLGRIEAYARAELERELTPGSGPLPAVAAAERRRRVRVHGVLRVVLVGTRRLAEALRAEDWAIEDGAPALEIERVAEIGKARVLVGERQPDLVVVDTDGDHAAGLVEMLLADERTDAIPLIVLGSWDGREQAAHFIALGAARCVAKPAPPGTLRRACLEVAPRRGAAAFEPIGAVNIDELSTRLTGEIHRWLADATEAGGRSERVDLGEGAEVLAALWDAIRRVRQLVTAKSQGQVRFRTSEPLQALPSAPWLAGSTRRRQADRAVRPGEARAPVGARALDGMRVLIAEDDPSTNWFISGVLREAGATVTGALDGARALADAYRAPPDLLLSDVVLPDLDGLGLCRRFQSDVILRTVPVVLISGQRELLQRARELGAGAHGYLLKDASAERIIQRLSELLRGRHRLTQRMADDDAMRGRLDGLGAFDVLRTACRVRPDARFTVRDAAGVYQIELRGGRPVCATRTQADGCCARGSAVLASLLAVGDGRFAVEAVPDGEVAAVELEGSLDEQLRAPVARARALQRLFERPALGAVRRVAFDSPALRQQLVAMPEPSRGLLRALAGGAAPQHLAAGGSAAALAAVLTDVARRGVVAAVLTQDGSDLLEPSYRHEIAAMQGQTPFAPEAFAPGGSTSAVELEPLLDDRALVDTTPLPDEAVRDDSCDAGDAGSALDADPAGGEPAASPGDGGAIASGQGRATVGLGFGQRDPVDASQQPEADPPATDDWPADRCAKLAASGESPIESLSDPSPAPERISLFDGAPLGRPSRPPPGGPPACHTPVLASVEVADDIRRHTPVLSTAVEAGIALAQLDVRRERAHDSRAAADDRAVARPRSPKTGDDDRQDSARRQDFDEPAAEPRLPRLPRPSAYVAHPTSEPRKTGSAVRWAVPLIFGAVGITLAVGARWMREHPLTAAPSTAVRPNVVAVQQPAAPADPAAPSMAAEQPIAETAESPATTGDLPVELPLSKKDTARLHDGEGLLEVVAGRNDEIYVGHKLLGKGPTQKVVLSARGKPYEVRVKLRGEERVRYVVVRKGKRLRLRVAPPWSR